MENNHHSPAPATFTSAGPDVGRRSEAGPRAPVLLRLPHLQRAASDSMPASDPLLTGPTIDKALAPPWIERWLGRWIGVPNPLPKAQENDSGEALADGAQDSSTVQFTASKTITVGTAETPAGEIFIRFAEVLAGRRFGPGGAMAARVALTTLFHWKKASLATAGLMVAGGGMWMMSGSGTAPISPDQYPDAPAYVQTELGPPLSLPPATISPSTSDGSTPAPTRTNDPMTADAWNAARSSAAPLAAGASAPSWSRPEPLTTPNPMVGRPSWATTAPIGSSNGAVAANVPQATPVPAMPSVASPSMTSRFEGPNAPPSTALAVPAPAYGSSSGSPAMANGPSSTMSTTPSAPGVARLQGRIESMIPTVGTRYDANRPGLR